MPLALKIKQHKCLLTLKVTIYRKKINQEYTEHKVDTLASGSGEA